jgi:hypothetical protein
MDRTAAISLPCSAAEYFGSSSRTRFVGIAALHRRPEQIPFVVEVHVQNRRKAPRRFGSSCVGIPLGPMPANSVAAESR